MSPPLSPTARAVAVVAGLAVIGGIVWIKQRGTSEGPETVQKVVFEPAEGVIVDRLRYQMSTDFGPNTLSTTLPVSTSVQSIPFAETTEIAKPKPNPYISPTDGDAAEGAATVPVKGAILAKFSNSQLCDANGACPIVLAAKAEGPELVKNAILQINAKNIWVSSRSTNGNPDLIVDYGVSGMQPIRMVWSTDGLYPVYDPVPPSLNQPLPPLK